MVGNNRYDEANDHSPQAAAMTPAPTAAAASTEPRRQALLASLRLRWAAAQTQGDAAAKQALFKEAVYLGIQPHDYQVEPGAN